MEYHLRNVVWGRVVILCCIQQKESNQMEIIVSIYTMNVGEGEV